MAGGPAMPALVTAAARAGGIGFLAAGYKTPQLLSEQMADVRKSGASFGVNLFVPNPVPIDPAAFRRYAATIQPEADRYDIDLSATQLVEDDDHWEEKVALLVAEPVALVSFTFGLPNSRVVQALRKAGSVVVQTVTTAEEALAAAEVGVSALAVQGSDAGGHSGTFTPQHSGQAVALGHLVSEIRAKTRLPVVAGGGLVTSSQVAEILKAGAEAAVVGTILLRSEESGASETYKAALADPDRIVTVVTRSFTGRPARGLRNEFIDRYEEVAPFGYPAIHHLTSPLRKAAAEAGDPERVNLWAGTGHRAATAEPALRILERLASGL
jgi:NAD(P)H-dependent flavin oxidoreductase YrpB (nitropropane dioxygenase family)